MNNIRASIDIGSNSTLLLVFNILEGKIISEYSQITSLGKDLDKTKEFCEASMNSTFDALKEYVNICGQYQITPEEIIATATEASRVAKNSDSFYNRIKNKLGLSVTLISGEAEAYYTALGVVKMSNLSTVNEINILDVGGASSELINISLNPFKINKTTSLPIGSVRATDWLLDNTFNEKIESIFNNFPMNEFECENIICVAGTLTTAALLMSNSLDFDSKFINSFNTTTNDLKKFIVKLPDIDFDKFSYVGKRKNSLYGGTLTSLKIIEKIKVTNIAFSTYGLRYGTLISGKIDEKFKL